MKGYNIINCRINKSVKPIDVLQVIEHLMQKNNVSFLECFIKLKVSIVEFEHEGKFYSNRNKNAILTVLKHYPTLSDLFEHKNHTDEDGFVRETLTIQNFAEETFSLYGKVEYPLIKEIAKKIPRPYSVNDLEITFNGIGFCSIADSQCKMKPSSSGFASPVGNYISYSRSNYGDEKHSYIQFSVDDNNLENMRKLFFEFCEKIPGKYEGTEYHT